MGNKIVIIDDEVDVMKMLIYRLKAKGYEVFCADNGHQGIEVVNKESVDLVILDYRLPDLKGNEIASFIKQKKDIPIILITASTENIEEKRKECLADSYILKPIEPEELYPAVEKFLKGVHPEQG
ncbi:MAG: response regulator [Candidatus Omnitrophota bacterium]